MRFRDRLRHDEATGAHFDGAIRYMMIRPDALMGIFARLAPEGRVAALDAFGHSIREHGRHSATTYTDGAATRALFEKIEHTAPDLGWGTWSFAEDGERLHLTVRNSPFAVGARGKMQGPVCHAITGMCEAVFELVHGVPGAGRETACAADGAEFCTFVVEPAAEAGRARQNTPTTEPSAA